MFPKANYGDRIGRVRRVVADSGTDALLLSVGADMPYFTGYEAPQLERLTMLVVPAGGEATLVVPRLEAPRVPDRAGAFDVLPWDEMDDPVAIVAGLVGRADRIAIGDHTWARFLLGLQGVFPRAEFTPATPFTARLRTRKDDDEVGWLRKAGEATDRVVDRLDEETFAGRTERDLARRVAEMAIDEGHDTASFAIVGSGPNGASPHHEAGDRIIGPGDAVVVDFGGRMSGYCSDTTRTFFVGEPTERIIEVFSILREAQATAVDAVAPGVPAQEIDRAARTIIDGGGYGEFFVHRTGHGIGLEVHEEPYIIEGNDQPLSEGMAFSVEPGIYLPGEFGMRIEDIVVVTADGVDRLNRSPRRLHVVG
jgi:Xaa-Pro aminopeptidase